MADELAAKVIEEAADEIDRIADNLEELAESTRHLTARDVSFALGGVVAGCVAGYFAARKHMQLKYQSIADSEIEEMKNHYNELEKIRRQGPKPELEEVVTKLGYKGKEGVGIVPDTHVTRYSDVEQKAIDEVAEAEARSKAEELEEAGQAVQAAEAEAGPLNVFDEYGEDESSWEAWNYDEELTKRTNLHPYVIHVDEWREGKEGHDQMTVTFFDKDGVVAGDRDEIMEKPDTIIGVDNLDKFGHGSQDPHIVYVRNEAMHIDIEVVKSNGSFSEEVLGVIRHSDERRRPVRWDDDDRGP